MKHNLVLVTTDCVRKDAKEDESITHHTKHYVVISFHFSFLTFPVCSSMYANCSKESHYYFLIPVH